MLNWYVGLKTDFKKNTGPMENKYYKDYLSIDEWRSFEATYADYQYINIWYSLFEMGSLFRKAAAEISEHFGYEYRVEDDINVTAYLNHVKQLPSDAKTIY